MASVNNNPNLGPEAEGDDGCGLSGNSIGSTSPINSTSPTGFVIRHSTALVYQEYYLFIEDIAANLQLSSQGGPISTWWVMHINPCATLDDVGGLHFPHAWIPAFAGMTGVSVAG
jgi:hypothetical protein